MIKIEKFVGGEHHDANPYADVPKSPVTADGGLLPYEQLFPNYPPPLQSGFSDTGDFAKFAPDVLKKMLRQKPHGDDLLCGIPFHTHRLTCGVHVADDALTGAPYVVPVPRQEAMDRITQPIGRKHSRASGVHVADDARTGHKAMHRITQPIGRKQSRASRNVHISIVPNLALAGPVARRKRSRQVTFNEWF